MGNIKNENARNTVYQAIRERIIHLDLEPGDTLNYKDLAEEMGISRTPVREAMLMLNIANLVEVRPQSGTFVSAIDLELIEMEQFTRCAQEKEMIRKVCDLITPENKVFYEENLHLYEFYDKLNIAGREEKLFKLDNDFHRIAFMINGKEKYYDKMHSSMHHIERLRILNLKLIKDDRILREHQIIAKAIIEGDSGTAMDWIEKHMNLYLEHLYEAKRIVPHYFEKK